jgi:hypothetical protein
MASRSVVDGLASIGLYEYTRLASKNPYRPVYTIINTQEGISLQTSKGKTFSNAIQNPTNKEEFLFYREISLGWKERAQVRKAKDANYYYCEIRSNAEQGCFDVWEYEEGDILFLKSS